MTHYQDIGLYTERKKNSARVGRMCRTCREISECRIRIPGTYIWIADM
jgi:hypothetical protein